MRLLPATAGLLAVVWVGAGCDGTPTPLAEIVLYNGKIFTAALEASPWAEAVLIRGDRIALVGSTAEIRSAAKAFGIVIVQNPAHFALGPMVLARYGAARLPMLQPAKSLLRNGIMLALGSDGPVNPFLNLMLAVFHPNNPQEALTMEQAVRAFTLGSAYAERRDRDKGRLGPGMLADVAVLSQDIFAVTPGELPKTVSVLTHVGGRPVHDPAGWLTAPPNR